MIYFSRMRQNHDRRTTYFSFAQYFFYSVFTSKAIEALWHVREKVNFVNLFMIYFSRVRQSYNSLSTHFFGRDFFGFCIR